MPSARHRSSRRASDNRRVPLEPELIDATRLDSWAVLREMQGLLPEVVRRLLAATPGVTGLSMPAHEGITAPSYDGRVDGGAGTAWVPPGPSVWELSVAGDVRKKFQSDYVNRAADPQGVDPAETAFVCVTG